jgi:F0F1-type ATP synthase assembly protein I
MSDPQKDKKATNFIRYTGIGFQMLATIGVFAFAGYKIDNYRNSEKLIFTALLGLSGVVISLYQIIRQLNSKE